MLNKLFSIYSISLLLFSCAAIAQQEKDWYSVEYIVFENKPLGNQHLEPWSKAPFTLPNSARVLNEDVSAQEFSLLKVGQQQLHGVLSRLKSLSSYQPLAHGGWIQPLAKNSKLQPIAMSVVTANQQLEGSINFHRGKYLHLDFDLQLSEMPALPTYDNTDISLTPHLYRLTESRRVKTGESNYFDHPRFGVIAIVEEIDSPLSVIPTGDLIKEKPLATSELKKVPKPAATLHNDN